MSSLVHYTCTDCLVGWSADDGETCWNCGKLSELREPVKLWWMLKSQAPRWRTSTDVHTTGVDT